LIYLVPMRPLYKVIIYSLSVFTVACGPQVGQRVTDTPTSGSINIVADDEFMPLTLAEVNAYMGLYAKTTIHPIFKPEDSAFSSFLNDSVRLIVSSRKLLPSEEDILKSKKLVPEQVKIASDAIVFIVNNDNSDTLLGLDQLKDIFGGKDSLWQQMNASPVKGKINVVFDHENSGNSRYLQQTLVRGQKFSSWCFALHNDNEVIDYVNKNVNALGVISLNRISNVYDSAVIKALQKVKVVALSAKSSINTGFYFKPIMDNILTQQYPLCRDIYIISREPYTGLGSGFLSFVASDKGQRVIYREGLLPARMPSHNLHF